ncbi:MAG: sensor histidine kinase [Oligoflexales bacterium]
MMTHIASLFAFFSAATYIVVMRKFINFEHPFLKICEKGILGVCILFLISLIQIIITGESYLYIKKGMETANIILLMSKNVITPTLVSEIAFGLIIFFILSSSVLFLKEIYFHHKNEKIIFFGTCLNFLLVINEACIVMTTFKYIIPMLFVNYFVESLRLTYLYQKKSLLKINDLEVELVQISKVAAMGYIAGNISHDIRNPLSVIDGTTHRLNKLLVKKGVPSGWEPMTKKIHENCHRVEKIIHSYLDLMRDDIQDPKQKLYVSNLIDAAYEMCEFKLSNSAIEQISNKVDKNCMITGIENQLVMAFVNLISNACDAISPLNNKWISVSGYSRNKKVILEFVDSGSGIAEDKKVSLFKKNFTTKEKGKGTGLGLDFVKKVIETHGGNISVTEVSNHTCFLVELDKSA